MDLFKDLQSSCFCLIESFRRVLPEHFLLSAAKISVAPVPLKLKEQLLWGFGWRSRTARDESRSTFHHCTYTGSAQCDENWCQNTAFSGYHWTNMGMCVQ